MNAPPAAVLTLHARPGERLYAVGDIHGCYDALMALEKKINEACKRAHIKRWRMISVGDLCDRGPASNQVIEHFATGFERGTHHAILGNHESFFILAYAGFRSDLLAKAGVQLSWFHKIMIDLFPDSARNLQGWKLNGGGAVFKSYGADIDAPRTWDQIPLRHIQFIFKAALGARTPKAWITHAMAGPGDYESLMDIEKTAVEPSPAAHELIIRLLWERLDPKVEIVKGLRHISGHTPRASVRRVKKLGVIQIDTGAVYGKSLTAIDLNSFRTISVLSDFNVKFR
jgi:hypothetical protein